jgi:hypothetical protein
MDTVLLFYGDNCVVAGSDNKIKARFFLDYPNRRDHSEYENANEKIILKCISETEIDLFFSYGKMFVR